MLWLTTDLTYGARRTLFAALAILPLLAAPSSATPQAEGEIADQPRFVPGDLVPPAFREAAYFAAGEAYVLGLTEGTILSIEKNDGTSFDLVMSEGRFRGQVPAGRLTEDGRQFVSPLGYRIVPSDEPAGGVDVVAPTGKSTRFFSTRISLAAAEDDGGLWDIGIEEAGLRLPDATRIDALDDNETWEVLTLGGERVRLDFASGEWTPLPSLPSPPLVPDRGLAYVAGDGNDWRIPFGDDHIVFAWNWYPYGFDLQGMLDTLKVPRRREDLRVHFIGLERMPDAEELGAWMIARRLSLDGGDRITVAAPGGEPRTTFVYPGPLVPEFTMPPYLPRLRRQSIERQGIEMQNR